MTYKYFQEQNNIAKRMGVKSGRVIYSSSNPNVCKLQFEDNESLIEVTQLVQDIVYNGMGCITNPSALKNWPGFSK